MKNHNVNLESINKKISLVENGEVKAVLEALANEMTFKNEAGTLIPIEVGDGTKFSHAVTRGQLIKDGAVTVAGSFSGVDTPNAMGSGKVQYCISDGVNGTEGVLYIEKDDGSFETLSLKDGQAVIFAISVTTLSAGFIKTGTDLTADGFKQDHIYIYDTTDEVYLNNGAIGTAYDDSSTMRVFEVELNASLEVVGSLPIIPGNHEIMVCQVAVTEVYNGTTLVFNLNQLHGSTLLNANDLQNGNVLGAFSGEMLFLSGGMSPIELSLESVNSGGSTTGSMKIRIFAFKKKV